MKKEFYGCGWLKLLTPLYGFGVRAITVYPFIFYKNMRPRQLVKQHERFHIKQVEKTGLIVFCWNYSYEYAKNRFNGMGSREAYRNISYEKEARRRS